MTTTKPFQLGSISTGTLKTEHLIPAFEAAINHHSCPWRNYSGMTDEEYLDGMTQDLTVICPPFVYFGAHPGDGADFGFWPDMDDLNEAIRLASNYQEKDASEGLCLSDDGVIVQVSDHGNVTVMDLNRNVLWSTV